MHIHQSFRRMHHTFARIHHTYTTHNTYSTHRHTAVPDKLNTRHFLHIYNFYTYINVHVKYFTHIGAYHTFTHIYTTLTPGMGVSCLLNLLSPTDFSTNLSISNHRQKSEKLKSKSRHIQSDLKHLSDRLDQQSTISGCGFHSIFNRKFTIPWKTKTIWQ